MAASPRAWRKSEAEGSAGGERRGLVRLRGSCRDGGADSRGRLRIDGASVRDAGDEPPPAALAGAKLGRSGGARAFSPPATGPSSVRAAAAWVAAQGVHVEVFAADRVVIVAAGDRHPAATTALGRADIERALLRRAGHARPDWARAGACGIARRCWPICSARGVSHCRPHGLPPSRPPPAARCRCSSTDGGGAACRASVPLRRHCGDRARGRAARSAAPRLHVPAGHLIGRYLPGRMPVRLQRGVVIRRLAPAALMPAGAFAVHQLRYWLAFGSHAGVELAAQGHSYLHSVVPWIVLLIGTEPGGVPAGVGPRARWAVLGAALHAFVRRAVVDLRGLPGGDLHHPGVPRGPVCDWASRLAWSGSSATAAGGRSRRRWRSGWCSPPRSTARVACSGRSPTVARERVTITGRRPAVSHGHT